MAEIPIRLAVPKKAHELAFLDAAHRSRVLHEGLVVPPRTGEEFRAYLDTLARENQLGYLVEAGDERDLAGVINVSEIVRGAFQSAYLGYYAFEPLAGNGIMRRGLAMVLDRCFTSIGLHRVEANIQPSNLRSIAIVQRLGFRLEGLSPDYLRIDGHWRDHERWAILADEWSDEMARRGES